MDKSKFLDILAAELVVALGCTEPIAVAYAAALARRQLAGHEISAVKVYVSGNVVKNAMAVTIPGTNTCGVDMAAALGVVAGDADKHLEVLAALTAKDVDQAERMIKEGIVTVDVADSDRKLYIEVNVHSPSSHAKVVVENEHTNIVLVEVDGKIVSKCDCEAAQASDADVTRSFLSIDSIWDFVHVVAIRDLGIVVESIELNTLIATEGLANRYGLQVGKTIKNYVGKGILGDDLATHAMALAAAGSDARMAGSSLPVMSNSGSGNQGISATMPVVAAGERLAATRDEIIRAVTLSHLITIYIKSKFGRLSAICGAIVSGTGASCGITYLLGGGIEATKFAIQNMLGNVTGMLCDGAKPGCAMKIATCTNAAVQSALLAIEGLGITETEGIIERIPRHSIENLCRIGNEGTAEADRIILDIMLNKQSKD
ncbi:MAG: L-serine ammonia-lyase, iron-sulfur-dependent, subunit alpha [Negativicutes bacterium]|nr:L-serine ammonia-lyase, iron-sulfur-dependent, subunit alpha [Negativicutes bacterium]